MNKQETEEDLCQTPISLLVSELLRLVELVDEEKLRKVLLGLKRMIQRDSKNLQPKAAKQSELSKYNPFFEDNVNGLGLTKKGGRYVLTH